MNHLEQKVYKNNLYSNIEIYKKYSKYVSQELFDSFLKYFKYFRNGDEENLEKIIYYEMLEELTIYVDKYLSLSKQNSYGFLNRGTTAACYQIGDYVFKLINMKWSYEEVICPNLYLILKNLEEHYIRDEKGIVKAGIEVQKYLTNTNYKVTSADLRNFKKELKSLGYFVYDNLIKGQNGDNCMLLDSYKDADYDNPELLPDSFKKKPLVLVDRDLVYKIGEKNIKCLFE